ncbi:MAG: class II fumarate hydratase [bacterium]
MEYRTEKDSLGEVQVPATAYYGAQTQRSIQNFPIGAGAHTMPIEVVRALALVKKAAAQANESLGALSNEKANAIARVCDEILDGKLDAEFPLVVWQTGSGTQTNMNVNEVIANRAHVLAGGALTDLAKSIHPNDDVNMSQSSNDVFPTAMHISAYVMIVKTTLPALKKLRDTFAQKSTQYMNVVKVGRTHMMDATPVTLGQEFSAYVAMLDMGIASIEQKLPALATLALGATAVGTGLNAPEGYAQKAIANIVSLSGLPFTQAPNLFSAIASHEALVDMHGSLKTVATSLMKIANDIRFLASGPRAGIAEIRIPDNEPGSSIMPGKVNPTQCEALAMVTAQVMGNDVAVSIGNANGHLELNVYKPLIIRNVLESAQLIGEASASFSDKCVAGIEPITENIKRNLDRSLMLVTALTPHIGYDKSAEIAKKAQAENTTLKESALALGYVNEADFDAWVRPDEMI